MLQAYRAIESALDGDLTHKSGCFSTGTDCSCGFTGFNRYLGRKT